MANSTNNPFGSATAHTKNPFGAATGHTVQKVNFSTNLNLGSRHKNQEEDMAAILNSAVGDFTERPLQIMIREIAKNFLIFTPIGWIILAVILGRKYKGKINFNFESLKDTFNSAIASLGLQKQGS